MEGQRQLKGVRLDVTGFLETAGIRCCFPKEGFIANLVR